MKNFSALSFNVFGNGITSRLKAMKVTVLTLLLCALSYAGFAAVTVTPASGGTNICSMVATSPTTLGPITISEGATTDFNTGASSVTLAPPPGWQFVVSLPTVTAAPGNDVSIGVVSISPGALTVNFNASGTTRFDVVTISNLQIQATSSGSAAGYLYASSDFGITGITTGAAGTNFGSLSIFTALVPSVTIAQSPSGPICAGSSVTFNPTPVNGGTSPTYQWFVNGSFVGGGSFYSTSTLANGNTVSTIMTAGGISCASPATATSNTIVMTVNPVPALTTVSGAGTFCGNTVLTASGGGGGTIYFQGTTSGGTSTVLGGTPQTVSSTGTYYFNSMSAAGCWGTQGSAAVTINPAATANAGAGQALCAGGTITLAGSIGGGASSATWSAPSGSFSNPSSLTSTYTPSIASGTVTLTLTTNDPDGAGPCTAAVSTMVVTVNPVPAPVIVSGAGTFCGNALLTASGGAGGTIYFEGNTSGGTSIAAPTSSVVVSASGTYYFRSGTALGCWGTEGSAAVTINPAATANAGLPQSVCAGGTVTLAGSIGGSASSSTWSAPSGSFSNPSSLTSTYTPSIPSGTVTLTLTTNDPDGAGPCAAATSTVVITVNPIPNTPTVSGGGTFCGSTSISASLIGPGTIFFQGTTAGGTSTVLGGTPQTVSSSGTYYFRAQSGLGCWGSDANTAVTINPLPGLFSITGGGSYCSGGTGVDVGMSSSEGGINYQLWRGVTLVTTVGGTGAAFSFGLQTTAGTYTAVAVNPLTGCTRNMSGSVTVAINALPTAFSVTGGGSYCVGGAGVVVGLSGSAAGVNYQLYNLGIATGAPVAGTGFGISFGNQTAAGTYTVIATNTTTGCTNTMTGSATVTINSLPVAYSVTGGGGYCSGGTGSNVGLSNSQTLTNYQLFRGATLVTTVGGTGAALSFGLQTVAGTYTVVATSLVTGCTNNMTGSATVSINPLPGLFTVTGGGSYCTGGSGVHVGLNGSAAGINYQLFVGASAVGSPLAGTGGSLDFGLETTAGVYTVVATDAVTLCQRNMTGSATVNLLALPTAFTVTGGGSYCTGGSGVGVALSGSQIGTNYQLYNLFTPVGAPVAGTGGILSFGLQTTAGFYTVTATTVATGCTNNMTGGVAVAIIPLPTAYNVTGGGGYCAGGIGVHVGLSSSDGGVNYQLFVGVTPTGAPVAGTGSAIDFGLQTTAGVYTVVATDATTLCTNNMTGAVPVIINAAPNAYALTGGGTYCAGGIGVDIGLAGSDVGIDYQLYNGGVPVGSAVAGTGGAIDFGFQTAAGTYTVVATNATTGCISNMTGSVTVTINPAPTAYLVIGGGGYCTGGTGVHVGLANSDIGFSYQLFLGGSPVGASLPGTGAALDFGLQTTAGIYTVVGTDLTTGCTGNMTGSASVVINPLPNVYIVTGGGVYCAGGTGVDVQLSNSDIGVNYQLYNGVATVGVPMPGVGGILDFGMQTAAGTYTVVATDGTTGCSNTMSSSAIVSINPAPTAYLVTGGGFYCVGGAGLHVGLASSDAGIGYQLYVDGVFTGAGAGGTGSAIDFGLMLAAGTYTVLATDLTTGCTSTMTGSVVITISPYPVVDPIAGTTVVCEGASTTLTDITSSGTWSSANPAVATVDASGNVTGVSAGSATISYTVTNPGGCATAATVDVLVLAAPTVSPIAGASNVCAGLTITLTDATPGGVWASSDVATATVSTGGVVTGVAFGSATISYTVTGGSGCTTTVTSLISVGNPMPPAALLPVGSATLCHGMPVNMSVVPSTLTGVTYQWYVGGVPIGGAVASTYVATVAGVYTASIDNGTCTETFANVNVVNPPNPVIFLDTAAGLLFTTTPFVTYQWIVDGVVIPGATSNNYPIGPLGTSYRVVVSDANGCTDTSAIWIYGGGTTRINTGIAAGDIKIYPNPVSSVLHIDAPAKVMVSVVTADGKVLVDRKEAVSLNVEQLAGGMYIIMVYDENNTLLKTEKFVKMQ